MLFAVIERFFKQHALKYIKFFHGNSIAQDKNIRPVVIIVNINYPFLTLTGPIFRRHFLTYFYENDCIFSINYREIQQERCYINFCKRFQFHCYEKQQFCNSFPHTYIENQANCEQLLFATTTKRPVQKSYSGQAFTYIVQATQG